MKRSSYCDNIPIPKFDLNDSNGIAYWKFIHLLELSSSLETLLSSSWSKSANISVHHAATELSQAIGFGSSMQSSSFPIVEQLLRVTTTIARDYYELGNNFINIDECILSSLAISIYLLVNDSSNSFSFLYDLYLLPGNDNLTIHDVTVLLHDTVKCNQHSKEKKGTKIKIQEITSDMLSFKKAGESALTPTPSLLALASTSTDTSSSLTLDDNDFEKIKFHKYMSLKKPPISQYIYLLDRFQIAFWGRQAWTKVKEMNNNSNNNTNKNKGYDISSEQFSAIHTKLLSEFCIFMKKIEAKMSLK